VSETYWFTVLGPVRAGHGGIEFDLGTPQQKSVLAALLLQAGRHVARHELVDWLWGENPPRTADQVIRTYIHRIRRVLTTSVAPADSPIRSVGTGYTIQVGPDDLDLTRFQQHVDGARELGRRGDRVGTRDALRRGLALWSGEVALADLTGELARRSRDRYANVRLDALAQAIELDIELGRPGEVVHELSELAEYHAFDERFARLLMLALYRCGRRAESLAVYARTRVVLQDELGVDPGGALQELHLQILRADDTPADHPPAVVRRPRMLPARPAQLPPGPGAFTGRSAELRQLDELLSPVGNEPASTRLICVHGMAGVGKTALAVHWAHSIASRFPDGQIYVNLRGFQLSGDLMPPNEALQILLGALGVPAARIPAEEDARTALMRTMLAGRQVLLMLDNVRSAAQVRPLLPGTAGCTVLVTSRNQLPSLVAIEHAHPLRLDALVTDEATTFLSTRIGSERAHAEPDQLEDIVALCGGLPLALTIVAARAVLHPEIHLSVLLEQLRAHHGTLEAFSDFDASIDARTVFSWSYRDLPPAAARMFRLLALHPGEDFGQYAAASVAGLPIVQARGLLTELTRANLLREHVGGRYLRHNLLRAYAGELLAQIDSEDERQAAWGRMLAHYLHSAHTTVDLKRQPRKILDVPPPGPGVTLESVAGTRRAL
jgi:DNA-binding SARP family transcriptional activator